MIGFGHNFAVCLDHSNKVTVWGSNKFKVKNIPLSIIQGHVTAISVGYDYIMALLSDGTIKCWGFNNNESLEIPFKIQGRVTAISAGDNNKMALLDNGKVYCWGNNNYKIPSIISDTPNITHKLFNCIHGPVNVIAISSGKAHFMALLSNGKVICWGKNNRGQCNVPHDIQGRVVAFFAGWYHSMVLLNDQTVRCWGNNTVFRFPADIQGHVIAISGFPFYVMVLLDNHTVRCWSERFTEKFNIPPDIQGNVMAISGGYNNFMAILYDGSIRMWGSDVYHEDDTPNGFNVNDEDAPKPAC